MTTPPLNFHRASYAGEAAAPDECAYCGRGITSEYYRVGGHMACPVCAQQAQSLVPPDGVEGPFEASTPASPSTPVDSGSRLPNL